MPISDAEIESLIKEIEDVRAVRVTVFETHHNEIGRLIIGWATGEEALPGVDAKLNVVDVAAFKAAFGANINLPEHITRIRFVQPDPGEYIIRLPGRELADQSRAVMKKLEEAKAQMTSEQIEKFSGANYPIPEFYDRFSKSEGSEPKPTELLNSRVADYTFAMCT